MFDSMTYDDRVKDTRFDSIRFLRKPRMRIRSHFRNTLIACSYFANSLTACTDNRALITAQSNISLLY